MYPLNKSSLPASHQNLLDNKTILVIGDEQVSWPWIRTTLKNYGIKLILIDSKPTACSPKDVYEYIMYDFSDHRLDVIHAERIIEKLSAAGIAIDGCCTFTDICGPLAAFVCEKLKLNGGVGVTGAINAWKKSATHMYLQKQSDGVHHFPRSFKCTGRFAKFMCKETLSSAIRNVGFPAICKPEHGSDGCGVVLIREIEELCNLNKMLDNLPDDGKSMMLMEFFESTEHDIEVIIYQGEIIAAFVSDSGPTRPGSFVETSMSMPSCLPPTLVFQLRTAASHCCVDIGLRNGVFNVEMKLTSTGPRLIEINGRMGGDYIRNWVYLCYRIDLLWCAMAISVGIRPTLPIAEPKVHVMGVTCSLPVHQRILSHADFGTKIDELITSGDIQFFGDKNSHTIDIRSGKRSADCSVAVVKENLESAKSALLKVCDVLSIHTSQFDVPYYLSHFVPHQ